MPLQPRPTLLYKHIANTGGQEAITTALRSEFRSLFSDGTFKILEPQESVTELHHEHAFIVATAQNPCALYVSTWTLIRERRNEDPTLSQVFNSSKDVSAWAAFTNASAGEVSRRYLDYVPQLSAVDCWVHTERIDEDLQHCLQAFYAQAPWTVQARLRQAQNVSTKDHQNGVWKRLPDLKDERRGGVGGGAKAKKKKGPKKNGRGARARKLQSSSGRGEPSSAAGGAASFFGLRTPVRSYDEHGTTHDCEALYLAEPAVAAAVIDKDAYVFSLFPEYDGKCCSEPRRGTADLVSQQRGPPMPQPPGVAIIAGISVALLLVFGAMRWSCRGSCCCAPPQATPRRQYQGPVMKRIESMHSGEESDSDDDLEEALILQDDGF